MATPLRAGYVLYGCMGPLGLSLSLSLSALLAGLTVELSQALALRWAQPIAKASRRPSEGLEVVFRMLGLDA